jgi:hypothetical protein
VRLWSLHPACLDAKGIVAVWREGLLARAVLRGATKGYRHHPQLLRFREHPAPLSAINEYLAVIADEADARGYKFDRSRIGPVRARAAMTVTEGQIAFEARHLRSKIEARAPESIKRLPSTGLPPVHPMFTSVGGGVEAWERGR